MKKSYLLLVVLYVIFTVFINPLSGQIGKIERSFQTQNGHRPTGLTWDGTYLWQIDYTDNRICKLDPTTGQEISSFPAPDSSATGLAWDGTNIWCSGNDTDKIYKLNTAGVVLGSLNVTSTPRGLEFVAGYLWYVDSDEQRIYKIDPANGTYLDAIPAPAGACRGLAFDGKYLWCADRNLDEIYKIDMIHEKVIMIIKSPAVYTYGLAWDGHCLWVAGYDSRSIFRLFTTGTNTMTILDSLNVHIQYKISVKNIGITTMALQTWICKPYSSYRQRLNSEIIWLPVPQKFECDQWNQEIAYYTESVVSGSSVTYSMDVNTTNYDVRYYIFPDIVGALADIPSNIRNDYTTDGENYDIHNPIIQNAVDEAIGDETNLYWQARKIHDYIIEHLYYENDGEWDAAPEVLTQGHGSCSEYTYLFVAMCRSIGIPARYEAGGHLRDNTPYIDTIYHRWHQVYLPPYGWLPVDATWDDKNYPANQARYFGGTSMNLFATTLGGGGSNKIAWSYNSANSRSGGSMERTREMIWTGVAQTATVTFSFPQPGWYMVSLPVIPSDSTVGVLFPSALGDIAFGWDPLGGSYTPETKMKPKKGYWLAIPGATTSAVSGLPLSSYTDNLPAQGWYMIGSVLGSVDFSSPNDNPNGSVLSPAFGWDTSSESYTPATVLNEKEGYWAAVFGECDLTVGSAGGGGFAKSLTVADREAFFNRYGKTPPAPPILDGKQGKEMELPKKYGLFQNYPNPFNPETTIRYQIPDAGFVKLAIYNTIGQAVRMLVDGHQNPGLYEAVWDGKGENGRNLESGMYLVRMDAGDFSTMLKMLLVR